MPRGSPAPCSAPIALQVARFATSTHVVLDRAQGGSLDARVLDWPAHMGASWNEALPEDGDSVAALLHDIVPAKSQGVSVTSQPTAVANAAQTSCVVDVSNWPSQ